MLLVMSEIPADEADSVQDDPFGTLDGQTDLRLTANHDCYLLRVPSIAELLSYWPIAKAEPRY